jgi:hypothetical protein
MITVLPSFSIVPEDDNPQNATLIVSMSTWVDGRCTASVVLFKALITKIPQPGWAAEYLPYSLEWADALYGAIGYELDRKAGVTPIKTDAQPEGASETLSDRQ